MSGGLIEYGMIEDVEHPSYYCQGGYCPISIDDRLRDRYRIVNKLGHGSFSTVWLAHDTTTSRYVAVKVGTAEAENTEVDVLLHIQRGLSASSRDIEKASIIAKVLDQFTLESPNGTHTCLVREAAGCSVRDMKETRLFHLDVARSLAAQLVMAVSLIHSKGYAHGDLHLSNLFLRLPWSWDHLSVEQFYEEVDKPWLEPIVRVDGKPIPPGSGVPTHAVTPSWLGLASTEIGLKEAKLLVCDFGEAFRSSDRSRFESNTPLVIRPPEPYFDPKKPLSFASDIWSMGCVIFEFIAHRSLINGDYLASQDDIIAQQIHLQGPPTPEWQHMYEYRSEWFDDAWKPISEECAIYSWDRRFE